MCFFKQIATPRTFERALEDPFSHFSKEFSVDTSSDTEFLAKAQNCKMAAVKPDINAMLMNCLGLINFNSQIMFAMDQKLSHVQTSLDSGNTLIAEVPPAAEPALKRDPSSLSPSCEKDTSNAVETKDVLTKQLFGPAGYKYKLEVDGEFPDTLYKERNFNFSVKLVDLQSGNKLNNGNIVNICLGICDDNGQWIHETKDGQAFVKGKLETELYHGTAGFVKMAARDVSRNYLNKTVNVVVYPKPTVLKYSGQSSIEENVDFSEIEPLVIHGVSIKAKKRE